MNTQMLQVFERQLDVAQTMQEPSRSRYLAQLMTDMERIFNIPMMRSEAYNATHNDVMALYLRISAARDI